MVGRAHDTKDTVLDGEFLPDGLHTELVGGVLFSCRGEFGDSA